jgi:small subunit ribosomal protein S6
VNHYELAYVLDPDFSQEELTATSESLTSLISDNGGSISASASWGKRRLDYEINKKREGCYFFVQFESEVGLLPELNRQLKLSDKVMRHMLVKLDERYLAEAALPAEKAEPTPATVEAEAEPAEEKAAEGAAAADEGEVAEPGAQPQEEQPVEQAESETREETPGAAEEEEAAPEAERAGDEPKVTEPQQPTDETKEPGSDA